ncbi:hypothetical protein [Endozoicomonas sp. YOMI1]|uniref:hypothetical protein n=1 Tax=Endozoicomonas sp. YOMI1 TaxID=2828739 RepID=UPI0021497447|nr:hypothetical protein [Endozoicomonas sp. YOMI1]
MANSSQSYISANAPNEGVWLMPVTGSHENPAPATGDFHSHDTLIQPLELQDLKIRGYSQQEIEAAEKTLQQRSITPTYGAISRFLDTGSCPDKYPLFEQLHGAIYQISGVQGKVRLAKALKEYAQSLNDEAVRDLDQHYASLWPDRQKIRTIVDLWPDALTEQAGYIKRYWPELVVKGNMVFNFDSTSKVCSNDYGIIRRAPSPLGYLAFFRLIKDIWFDAINTNNKCAMNRVSHLLISFTKAISDNTRKCGGGSRKEQFENVIQRELKKGISSTYDIGAFAFLLVTAPALWRYHKNETFKLMISRAFNSKADKLAPLYSQWQNPARQDQTCKTVEAEVIPEIAITLHYLESIFDYLVNYRTEDYWSRTLSKEIASGQYFDSATKQLANPIQVSDWKTLPHLPEIKETLSQFYANPNHQKLFLGTEEFKAYQKEQRRLKTRQRFTEAIKITTKQIKKEKADRIKKEFKEQGFAARQDSQGNISYGEAYYKQRKKYISYLKEQKLAVEQQIGVSIPFKVKAAQLNQTLDAFNELPTAEQRYWKMSAAYAKSTAIPELLADLTLTQESEPAELLAHEHENLKEHQSKLITCRCSECTICEATRYLCECRDGLNQRIAKRENKRRDGILKQKIIKSVKAYYAKNFCTKGAPVLEEDNQTAIPLAQTQNPNKRKRTKPFVDRDKSTLSRSAKMPRLEHIHTDGSLCEKKHHSESVINKHQRKFITTVLHKKVYAPEKVQRRHQRSAEPAGQQKYNQVLRQLYKHHADISPSRISTTKILDWFDKNPEQAAAAVNDLQGRPQEIRSLFKPGTLEFATPKTLKAIPCQVIYHDIESFNKHLHALATKKNNNFVPLDNKKVKGLYLHKTFCLACRTNFGQKRELQAHLKETHQATMDKTFASIRAMGHESTDEPAPITMLDSPIDNTEPQAFEQIPFDQQSQACAALFEHERT